MEFFDEVKPAITISDKDGKIVYMNDSSVKVNGEEYLGQNILDIHSAHAIDIIKDLMDNNSTNAYTIEKGDVKKLIYQTPWYKDGEFAGLVEFSLPIPKEMKHYIRQVKKD